MSIFVTGATGQLGRLVIADLLAAGVPANGITAVARSEEKAADLVARGVGLHLADYDRPETFTGAFRAEDRVLLISATDAGRRTAQHAVVIDAAKAARVAQLAYVGVFGGPKADFLLADDHRETEQLILDSGLPYTFLRNNWYSEMYTGDLAGIVERGAIANNVAPGSRIATAPRSDFAAAAAAVLHADGHLNQAYELGGDTAWTFEEFAEELTRQTGKKVVHTTLAAAEHKAILTGVGVPEGFADILVDVDDAISRGLLAATPGDLSRLIGRPTTPIADTIAAALAS
ncbi:SDR family oxidoreductase [Planotetraspora phitsanulokensis]|uniref:NAD(P)-dependent oxidoreductase n=1 Tax=Planotetraspora phitsanulokensis TaxID=575192 RepID=A0A8J3XEZ0_9ACTN|nr:SDR family oxidoreductase [Planotetraspora phitsanulokensis]GII37731.1 NAD(P)-dependent oxidoreductase [Planotetraspora phitsanulokensis]